MRALITIAATVAVVSTTAARAQVSSQEEQEKAQDLATLSLRDLLDIEISSVSRKIERLSDASASIYVITQEDIRRMAATSLPEALRVVPGLHVARIDKNKWAISSRGFANQFSNKLLVLVDGRTVYTPLFSGVYWDAQDLIMEDVARIEVIRGPGAALWGANAVNGVINVITRSAQETEGLLVTAGAGSEESYGALRFGGRNGEHLGYRLFAKYSHQGSFVTASGEPSFDSWRLASAGFRLDWAKDRDTWSLLGNLYRGELESTLSTWSVAPPYADDIASVNDSSGTNLLSRWTRNLAPGNSIVLQAYYDRTRRDEPHFYVETRNTFDLDFQHGFLAGRHDLLWGSRFRHTMDELPDTGNLRWTELRRHDQIVSFFLHDRIMLVADRVRLTLGSKFEHNDYTGFEIQPNLRLAWTPDDHAFWGEVSRAVRSPARFERSFELDLAAVPMPTGLLGIVTLTGSPEFVSEEVIDYEVGYRFQPLDRFSLDAVGFYNDYGRLSSIEPLGSPRFVPNPAFPHVQIRQTFRNLTSGTGYGAEFAVNVLPLDPWRLGLSYSYLELDLKQGAGSVDPAVQTPEGYSPRNQFRLQCYLDLPGNLQLDSFLYYVDELPSQDTPSYTRVDVRLGWSATDHLELALVGQNLFADRHLEFSAEGFPPVSSAVERSISLQLRWRN